MTNFLDIDPRLCHSCGTCVAVCPEECLKSNKDEIVFDENKCNDCKLCYNFCPGLGVSFPKVNRMLFNNGKYDERVGHYKKVFVGRTNKESILNSSSSGGLVPTLLIYALKKNIVNGAIVVTADDNDPSGYKFVIARSVREILGRSRSMYRLLPLNQVLCEVKESDKLAFVGLPCHVEGIRKLQLYNHPLGKNIKLILGIFCGLNQSEDATGYFIRKLNVDKDNISEMGYRGKRWSDGFYIKTKDGKERTLSKNICDFSNYMFIKDRCMLCYNFTNEFADISFGDAWSKLPSDLGWSEVIVRTDLGESILNGALGKELISLEKSTLVVLLKSHPGNFSYKKKGVFYRFKKIGIKPDYGVEMQKLGFKTMVFQSFYYGFIRITRNSVMRSFISLFPLRFVGVLFNLGKIIGRFIVRRI